MILFYHKGIEKKVHGFEALKELIREDGALHANIVEIMKERRGFKGA